MTRARGLLFIVLGMVYFGAPLPAQKGTVVRIIQTNSAGTNAHLIDPATHKVVAVIEGIPKAHNAADHPEGLYYYFANEQDKTVDVVDTRTLRVIKQIPLSDTPNKAAINKSLRKLYVGIRGAPFVDVIDVDSNKLVKSIPVLHGVHNVYVTADDRYAIAGMGRPPRTPDEPTIQVIDTKTDEVVWGVTLQGFRVRPMALESNPDGSTKRLFAQASDLHGFFVVDWNKRQAMDFISPPPIPVSKKNYDGIQEGPSHGLAVLPDQSALWFASRIDSSIYGWSLPDLKFLGGVLVGPSPQWITARPDSRVVYVSVVGTNETIAVDVRERKVLARIPVGHAPKRNSTHVIPADRVETVSVRHD